MIKYHGSPMSGGSLTAIKSLQGKHSMVSFARPEQLPIVAEMCQSFCIDNGAFTAWKQGTDFDVGKYGEFIERIYRMPSFDWYVIPDIIDGTAEQNMAMIAHWRDVVSDYKIFNMGVPVWHMHEPIEVLEAFCHSYPRVCLGSSGEFSTVGDSRWWNRMSQAMDVACDDLGRPKAKLHGLRMLDPTIFSHLPFASADSTNAARNCSQGGRFNGAYAPVSNQTRALIIMERIESHASASRWSRSATGQQNNLDLFG